MSSLGLGLLGLVIGFVGSELLRAANPDLVKRIEESSRRFAERLSLSASKKKKSKDRSTDA